MSGIKFNQLSRIKPPCCKASLWATQRLMILEVEAGNEMRYRKIKHSLI
jgi:hypothetical protein